MEEAKPYEYSSYHGSTKLDFKPSLKPGKWVVTKIQDILLFAENDICNPNTSFNVKAKITIAKMKIMGNIYEPWYEDYAVVIDMEAKTFKCISANPGKNFSYENEQIFPTNIEEVMNALKDQIIAGAKDRTNAPVEQEEDDLIY